MKDVQQQTGKGPYAVFGGELAGLQWAEGGGGDGDGGGGTLPEPCQCDV